MNEEELKKGCGMQLKVGQGNLSPNKTRELGVGIKCGEKYVKDRVHRRRELIGKVIYCDRCEALIEGFQKGKLEQKREELKRIIELQKKIRRYLIDNSRCDCLELTTKYGDISDVLFWEYEKQLQKEIGEEEQDE